MKKREFAAGICVGAVLFGSVTAGANVVAKQSHQPIYVDGERVEMTAYDINGNNYVKLRDIGQAVGFGVVYDAATDSVHIDPTTPYREAVKNNPVEPSSQSQLTPVPIMPAVTNPTAQAIGKRVSPTMITSDAWAREDFSQAANLSNVPPFTKDNYNAIRQTIVDKERIMQGNQEDDYNPQYTYAHAMVSQEQRTKLNLILGRISGTVLYQMGVEPGQKNYYQYPDYYIIKTTQSESRKSAVNYIKQNISHILSLNSREKIYRLNEYLCSLMQYELGSSSSYSEIFSSHESIVKGDCSQFANAFNILCDVADIPCFFITGENHVWNMVYADGEWLYVDVSLNAQVANHDALLLSKTARKNDEYPQITEFCKELLVPGSTK